MTKIVCFLVLIAHIPGSAVHAKEGNSAIGRKMDTAFELFANDHNEEAIEIADNVIAELQGGPASGGDGVTYCAYDKAEARALRALASRKKQQARISDGHLCFAIAVKGFALLVMNRIEEADLVFTELVDKAPLNIGYIKRYGYYLQDRGEWRKYVALYRRLILNAEFAAPAQRVTLLKRAYSDAGFGLVELGQLDEAEAAYRKLLELLPDNSDALEGLADIEKLRGTNLVAPKATDE